MGVKIWDVNKWREVFLFGIGGCKCVINFEREKKMSKI